MKKPKYKSLHTFIKKQASLKKQAFCTRPDMSGLVEECLREYKVLSAFEANYDGSPIGQYCFFEGYPGYWMLFGRSPKIVGKAWEYIAVGLDKSILPRDNAMAFFSELLTDGIRMEQLANN